MDYYASDSLGAWTVNNEANRPVQAPRRTPRVKQTVQLTDTEVKVPIDSKSEDTRVITAETDCTAES